MDPITEKRIAFFRYIFGETEGYVCLARFNRPEKKMLEEFFQWPKDELAMASHVDRYHMSHDMYYASQLFRTAKRTKDMVLTCPNVWADLDTCPPASLLVAPSILIETSPARYQGIWVTTDVMAPEVAEDCSRRIAYYHSAEGADKSGWDLTQLLRVPFTYNHKYSNIVTKIVATNGTKSTPVLLQSTYPQVDGFEYTHVPLPEVLSEEHGSKEDILRRHQKRISKALMTIMVEEPEHDWSKVLWQLEIGLFEAGLSPAEVFILCKEAACNKYARDSKNEALLWQEVLRAQGQFIKRYGLMSKKTVQDYPMLTDDERVQAAEDKTIVEEYIEWASGLGDAAVQYHQAGAFTILSSLMAGPVRLPTSYGTVLPNLWFMILGDTTLTRKTTAMDIAMELLTEIDSDIVLATDGSIEGLFTSLAARPGKPSVFLRDEFSGMLDMMVKKDYYAGMAETLTKLYDGKMQKRVLRREVIEVKSPVLILLTGGIKNKTQALLSYEHVSSGFLPRFVFITAESTIKTLRPLGPPTEEIIVDRSKLSGKLQDLKDMYAGFAPINIGGKSVMMPQTHDAKLTPQAWQRYNKLEESMLDFGINTAHPDIFTPTFDRLSKSILKAAVLISASRMKEEIIVTEADIVKAISYGENWRMHAIEIVSGVGLTTNERLLDRIYKAIVKEPGVTRGTLMQNYHLSARDASSTFDTLEQRGLITAAKSGKGFKYYPVN